eukprot:652558-Pleurochrysis_carterae.AAC.1
MGASYSAGCSAGLGPNADESYVRSNPFLQSQKLFPKPHGIYFRNIGTEVIINEDGSRVQAGALPTHHIAVSSLHGARALLDNNGQ